MSRVKLNKPKKPIKPGKQVTIYFNKEVPAELFHVVNANIKNANSFLLEVLSVVFESPELYESVRGYMGEIPSGRIYNFPNVHKSSVTQSTVKHDVLSNQHKRVPMDRGKDESIDSSKPLDTLSLQNIEQAVEVMDSPESSELVEPQQPMDTLESLEIKEPQDTSDTASSNALDDKKQREPKNKSVMWKK
ncbi:hypothetical protein BHU72_14515 [Desulfuribacillus stibiiarsenatis]|uniref:Uncharacterized protein n=1 Tax=Desulfuribacillus stibiiarsenatis TaxID=1390249 RepID=A0A1E5L7A7_9FIRM|nr:hypothetical protein [Desulfuribacillus stibiiarsenatis]OEH86042.1 hypothetical protein BHU72_14515 [Desulfuribacillus stibiiarsenatis]